MQCEDNEMMLVMRSSSFLSVGTNLSEIKLYDSNYQHSLKMELFGKFGENGTLER